MNYNFKPIMAAKSAEMEESQKNRDATVVLLSQNAVVSRPPRPPRSAKVNNSDIPRKPSVERKNLNRASSVNSPVREAIANFENREGLKVSNVKNLEVPKHHHHHRHRHSSRSSRKSSSVSVSSKNLPTSVVEPSKKVGDKPQIYDVIQLAANGQQLPDFQLGKDEAGKKPKEKLSQLWPNHWGSYIDQPERDSLDGNLPSTVGLHASIQPDLDAGEASDRDTIASLSKKPWMDRHDKKDKEKKKLKQLKSEPKPDLPTGSGQAGDKEAGNKGKIYGSSADEREAFGPLWVSLSSMYGKIIVIAMLAFCLTEVMDNSVTPLTLQSVYLVYLFVGSIAAIICVYISLLLDQCPKLTSSRENLTADPEIGSLASFGTLKRAHISKSKIPRTSFYLRVGALVFGLATLVFNGLEIAMHSTLEGSCVEEVVYALPILQALFTFLQMHFLFVNSEVLVERFGVVARFGFMHLVATNIALWVRTIVWESANEWLHFLHQKYHLGVHDIMPGVKVSSLHSRALHQRVFPPYTEDYAYDDQPDDDLSGLSSSIDYATSGAAYAALPCNSSYIPISDAHIMQMVTLYQCFNNNTLGKIWYSAMPHLLPYLVEYKLKFEVHFGLIAASVAFVLWRNVGGAKIIPKARKLPTKKYVESSTLDRYRLKGQWKVDCQNSSKGLLLGLLCLVGGIIVLVIFFVMKENGEHNDQMFWICTGTQIAALSLASFVTCVGFVQLSQLSVVEQSTLNLDIILSNVAVCGVYMFAVFGLIVGGIKITDPKHAMTFVHCLLMLVQVTLQGMFMAEITKRHCVSRRQMLFKPARQIVTFLLFANITIWLLDMFMTHHWMTQELQFSFYGFLTWGVISRISLPLVVFYRFHSAVVLTEVWKNSYRTKEG